MISYLGNALTFFFFLLQKKKITKKTHATFFIFFFIFGKFKEKKKKKPNSPFGDYIEEELPLQSKKLASTYFRLGQCVVDGFYTLLNTLYFKTKKKGRKNPPSI